MPLVAYWSGGPADPLRPPPAADTHCVRVLQASPPACCRPSGLPAAFCTYEAKEHIYHV